jgi:RNA polymerase sigma factor (sigma-70 family)
MEAHSVPRGGGLSLPRSRRLLTPLGDDRLVEQVRRGNDAAFEVIFDRHHRGILSFCRHMLASVEEAEDAVQHTFVQAYDSMRRSNREIKVKAWLYAIARNRCLSVLRARREQAAELDDIPTAGLSEAVQQRTDLREMLADIQRLPEEQRAALVLSELGDLSHADIAAVVGCEATKVKSLVFQARSSLIETRNARAIPCHEIREQLATGTGGALRRGPLRRHVKDCDGCAEFRRSVMNQRKAMAALLPVVPSAALKQGALAAVGIGGGASAATGGVVGSGIAGALGTTTAGKAITVIAVSAAAVSGGVVVTEKVTAAQEPAATTSVPATGQAPRASAHHAPGPGVAAFITHPPKGHDGRPVQGQPSLTAKPERNGRAPEHTAPGHHSPHAEGSPLPENQGTSIAPGLNETAGQGQPDGVGNNDGADSGSHLGSENGNANGRPSEPPKQGGRSSNPPNAPGGANEPKPDKPPKQPSTAETTPAPAVPDLPPQALPGRHVGSAHTG